VPYASTFFNGFELGKNVWKYCIEIFDRAQKKCHMCDICTLDMNVKNCIENFIIYNRLFPLEKRKEKEIISLGTA
jgi:hypothetical protein